MPQDSTPANSTTVSIYPILSINFVGTLGFSIILPFLVFLVERWGGNALIYGVVGATYSVFQLVGAPILGRWSDRFGRRKILLLSQLGTLFSWVLFLVALYLPLTPLYQSSGGPLGVFTLTLPLLMLFIARACDGLTGGNLSVANAYLADITPDNERNKNFGRMAVAANLGFIFGPMLAGLLGGTRYGEALPVMAALLISVIASLLIILKLPEPQPCDTPANSKRGKIHRMFGQEQRGCYEHTLPTKLPFRDILRIRHVPLLLVLYFLVMLGFNFFYVAFPVHAVRALQWRIMDTGIFFAVLSVLMVLVQGPLLGFLSTRTRDGTLIISGSLILAISFLFFTSPATGMIYTGAALLALGNGIMWPSLMALLSKAAGSQHQGAVQGFAGSCGAVASIAGLIIGGAIYESLGGNIFAISAGVIFVVFGVALVILLRINPPGDAEASA